LQGRLSFYIVIGMLPERVYFMLLSNIIGGLGNQMFQYAVGRACSIRTGMELRLATDMFEGYTLHQGFELKRVFDVPASVASAEDIRSVLGWKRSVPLRRIIGRLNWNILSGPKFVVEGAARTRELCDGGQRSFYLQGYWQSERYFRDCEREIRADFTFGRQLSSKNSERLDAIRSSQSVSIHVRGADYLSNAKNRSIYAKCGTQYYTAAIRHMRERLPAARFFVFSDDRAWVQEVLQQECPEMEIITDNKGPESYVDMQLMSACKNHVIANSTFSWWAAWLNDNPDKIVIAPARWYEGGLDEAELVPEQWMRLQIG